MSDLLQTDTSSVAEAAPAAVASSGENASADVTATPVETPQPASPANVDADSTESSERQEPDGGNVDNIKTLREGYKTYKQQVSDFQERYGAIEPVRDHVTSIVDTLTTVRVDERGAVVPEDVPRVNAALEALAAIDQTGANALAGHLMAQYGRQVFGASPDEIAAALAAVRSGQAARPQVADPAQPAPYAQPYGQPAAGPLQASWDLLSPEEQAYIQQVEADRADKSRRLAEYDQQRAQTDEQATATEKAGRVAEYQSRFHPGIRAEIEAWRITDPQAQADFYNAVEASVARSPEDTQIVNDALGHAAENRQYAANAKTTAIEAIYKRHIGLVANRLLGERQQQQVAAADAARERAAQPQTPTHVPGSAASAPPSQPGETLSDRLQRIYAGR